MAYQHEHELFENIKDFWGKYNNIIIYITLLILGVMLFWKWWSHRTYSVVENSSVIYNEVLSGYFSDDKKYFLANVNKLIEEGDNTLYADFARLLLAKKLLEEKNSEEAKKHLLHIVHNSKQKNIADLANIRLAKIYVDEKSFTQALAAIANISDNHLKFFAHEVRGDIYVEQKKISQARQEYELAISKRQDLVHDGDNILLFKMATLTKSEQ